MHEIVSGNWKGRGNMSAATTVAGTAARLETSARLAASPKQTNLNMFQASLLHAFMDG